MFTHLHIHTTQGSLLDSILTVEDAVKFASENPYRARTLASMMIKYTEGKYFAEVNDMDSLVKVAK